MNLTNNKSTLLLFLGLILISLAVGTYAHWPTLTNEYIIVDDDVMQHTYWMDKFHDPELFQNDIYAEYANFYLPLGFKAVYYVGTIFFDQKLFGKILAIILYVVSGVYLFYLGKKMGNNYTGLLLFLLFICFPIHLDRFFGGQFRAFAFPLLITFIYYLIQLRLNACVIIMLLMALLYPPALLIAYVTLFLFLLLEKKGLKDSTPWVGYVRIFLPLTVFLIFLCAKNFTKPEFLGSLTGIEVITANIESIVYGRSPNLPVKGIGVMIKDFIGGHQLLPVSLVLFCLSGLYYFNMKNQSFLRSYKMVISLFFSSIILYQISILLLIKLYLPIKYVRYSFPLVGLFIIILSAGFLIDRIRPVAAKIIVFIAIIGTAWFYHGDSINRITPNVDQTKYRGLYRYISKLPKNITIAADPDMSDYISTFSRRKTFLKYELSYPWFENYAKLIEKRIMDFYQAYYSENLIDIYMFCKKNDIDFIVFNRNDYNAGYFQSKDYNIEDVNKRINEMIHLKKDFAVNSINPKNILHQTSDGNVFIVKANKETFQAYERDHEPHP